MLNILLKDELNNKVLLMKGFRIARVLKLFWLSIKGCYIVDICTIMLQGC